MRIYKYTISADRNHIEMPRGARILTVQEQYAEPKLWAIVDPEAPMVTRGIFVAGTGHPLPDAIDEATYVGTFQLRSGTLVFHVFDFGEA